jgi:hypothetical protein
LRHNSGGLPTRSQFINPKTSKHRQRTADMILCACCAGIHVLAYRAKRSRQASQVGPGCQSTAHNGCTTVTRGRWLTP